MLVGEPCFAGMKEQGFKTEFTFQFMNGFPLAWRTLVTNELRNQVSIQKLSPSVSIKKTVPTPIIISSPIAEADMPLKNSLDIVSAKSNSPSHVIVFPINTQLRTIIDLVASDYPLLAPRMYDIDAAISKSSHTKAADLVSVISSSPTSEHLSPNLTPMHAAVEIEDPKSSIFVRRMRIIDSDDESAEEIPMSHKKSSGKLNQSPVTPSKRQKKLEGLGYFDSVTPNSNSLKRMKLQDSSDEDNDLNINNCPVSQRKNKMSKTAQALPNVGSSPFLGSTRSGRQIAKPSPYWIV